MGYEDRDLGLLAAEIQKASVNIERGDAAANARIDGIEKSVNELFRKAGRPRYNGGERDDGADFERKSAFEMCAVRHAERVPKDDGVTKAYLPSSGELDEARPRAARFRMSSATAPRRNWTPSNKRAYPPSRSRGPGCCCRPSAWPRSCHASSTQATFLDWMGRVNISSPSAVFLIENPRMGLGLGLRKQLF